MKLQKIFLTALASGLFFSASAQQTYIKVGAGYNFGMASDISYQATSNITVNNGDPSRQITSYDRVNVNYGNGLLANAAIGHQFSKHIGAELALSYLHGSKSEIKNTETITGNGNFQGGNSQETNESYSRMTLVQPSLVFSSGMEGKLNPYTRFGLVLAFGSVHGESNYSDSDGNSGVFHEKLTGGVGLGLQAALGTDINLSDKSAFYTELTFNNLSYAPTKGELTKCIINGRDRLPSMQTSQKEAEFVDNYTEDTTVQPNSSQPFTGAKVRYTMNSIGLQVGVKFRL